MYDVLCVSVHAHASTDTILKTQLCITYVYIIHKMYKKCSFTHGNQKLLWSLTLLEWLMCLALYTGLELFYTGLGLFSHVAKEEAEVLRIK